MTLGARQDLANKAEDEVMACIGCNDCMVACPLPQAKNVSIAELNAAVHLPIVLNPRVAEFVTACTQCRQCVPVCPADLSRADMVLYNKMKVEDRVPNFTLMLQVGRHVMPSGWTLDALADKLASVPLFEKCAKTDRRALLLKATLRQLQAGEVVCHEGEFYDRLCVVLSGSLDQSIRGPWGRPVHLLVLGESTFFGEMAVMADQPEVYTMRATGLGALVLEIPNAAVHRLMTTSATFKETMEELYRRRALWTYARTPSVLSSLPEHAITELLKDASLTTLKGGEIVLREGKPPTDVFIVRHGFFKVTRQIPGRDERVLVYFREGDLFGLAGLLFNEQHTPFTVQATTRAEIIRIPGIRLLEVLAAYPHARATLEGAAADAERAARQATFMLPPVSPDSNKGTSLPLNAEVLVEKGLAAGREVLVIDTSACVNCNACVEACGRRHKYSRLQLRGLQVENYLFPTACRHCEDPVCLLCSVNGIIRLRTGEITIVEQNCIGCGACAERCPYGNISMHPVSTPEPPFLKRLLGFFGWRDKEEAHAELRGDHLMRRVAVKCDLCAGHGDYACVTACPVGAAFRIDPMKALEMGPGSAQQRYG